MLKVQISERNPWKAKGGLHIIDPISRPFDVDDLKMWGPFMVGVPKKGKWTFLELFSTNNIYMKQILVRKIE